MKQLRRPSTFEVVGVDLDAADHSRMTKTEHGPLPTRNLEDPPLVHLQYNQQGNSYQVQTQPLLIIRCSEDSLENRDMF